jgi:hypothetical protein
VSPRETILAYLKATPEGMSADSACRWEFSQETGKKTLQRLAIDGLIRWVAEPISTSYQRRRYYAIEHAPEGAVFGKQVRNLKRRAMPKPVFKGGITQCPHGVDHRFTAKEAEPVFSALRPGQYIAEAPAWVLVATREA